MTSLISPFSEPGDVVRLGKADARYYAFKFSTRVAAAVHQVPEHAADETPPSLSACPVCTAPPSDPVCLPCSHVVCWPCAVQQFKHFTQATPVGMLAKPVVCPACDAELLPPGSRLAWQQGDAAGDAVPMALLCRPVHIGVHPQLSAARRDHHLKTCTAAGAPLRAEAQPALPGAPAPRRQQVGGAKRMRATAELLDDGAQSLSTVKCVLPLNARQLTEQGNRHSSSEESSGEESAALRSASEHSDIE